MEQLAVRQVTFSEAEDLDDQYYASLSEVERLEILMELRSMIDPVLIRLQMLFSSDMFVTKKFKLENDLLIFRNCAVSIQLNIY